MEKAEAALADHKNKKKVLHQQVNNLQKDFNEQKGKCAVAEKKQQQRIKDTLSADLKKLIANAKKLFEEIVEWACKLLPMSRRTQDRIKLPSEQKVQTAKTAMWTAAENCTSCDQQDVVLLAKVVVSSAFAWTQGLGDMRLFEWISVNDDLLAQRLFMFEDDSPLSNILKHLQKLTTIRRNVIGSIFVDMKHKRGIHKSKIQSSLDEIASAARHAEYVNAVKSISLISKKITTTLEDDAKGMVAKTLNCLEHLQIVKD